MSNNSTYELIIEAATKEEADTICDILAQNGFDNKVKIVEITDELKAGRTNGGGDALPSQDF